MGWYEADPYPTFQLLEHVPGWNTSRIFIPGAGTSILVDRLLEAGAHLVLNDLSGSALNALKQRLNGYESRIEWIVQNIAEPLHSTDPDVDVWIDRAVLHFLTDEDEIEGYFSNLSARLKQGGHVLFEEFPPHGAPRCAGLDLHRYSLEEFVTRLGDGFKMVDHFDHTYISPAGEPRPYIYALFQRKETQ